VRDHLTEIGRRRGCGHGNPLPVVRGLQSKDNPLPWVKKDKTGPMDHAVNGRMAQAPTNPGGSITFVKPRILVVEDERAISEPLAENLEREGFAPEVAPSLASARDAYAREAPDLILLDVMLPDGDGRDLARDVRKESDVPIIMLTARGEEIDRVLGLELGADDYVVKPFSARELTARIRAILRRGRLSERRGPIEIGAVHLDPASRTVTKGGSPVELAAREFDLLHLLMANAGEVLRREQIMDEVWDPHWFGPTKTLDVHISWLRKKIEDDPAHPRYITTIRGVGFRFASDEEMSAGVEAKG
jgi:two-component system response regulator RegX3